MRKSFKKCRNKRNSIPSARQGVWVSYQPWANTPQPSIFQYRHTVSWGHVIKSLARLDLDLLRDDLVGFRRSVAILLITAENFGSSCLGDGFEGELEGEGAGGGSDVDCLGGC
jgi:hypothetical protein